MPPKQKAKTRRTERCVYIEGGVRCRRSGTSDPALCNPHRIAMRDAAKSPPPFGDGVRNLVDRFVSGKRVTRKVIEDALGDVVTAWSSSASAQHQQPSPGHARQPPPPPPWWSHIPRPQAAPPPRPPPDPRIDERRRARITLGFAPSQPLTLEMITKKRRELARKHHPDRGGSVSKMQAVNAAADVLEAELQS